MIFITHIAGAILVSIILSLILNLQSDFLILFAVLGSLFPDIDTPFSIAGRRIKILGYVSEHRHFFHSVFLCCILTVLLYLIMENIEIAAGFLIGYLSHILLDSATKSGVAMFSPFSDKKIRGPFRTNSVFEYIVLLIILAGIWSLVYLGALRT